MNKTIFYNGTYINVSDSGVITWNNSIRKHNLNKDGYPVISIKTEKGWRQIGVARLVATAFIPNPNNLPEVNHKDYNRSNFSIDNLEWISRKDNVRYSLKNRKDFNGKNNPNYGNHKLSLKYKNDPEYAKEKQGRPGIQNGRYIDGRYMRKSVTTIP